MLVLKAVCSECATINDNDAKFCKHCGVGSHDRKIDLSKFDTTKLGPSNPYAIGPYSDPRCPSCNRLMLNKTCFFCTPTAAYA